MPSKKHPAEAFVAANGNDGVITAGQLAELVGRDGKTVRARLRRISPRTNKEHGARWLIDVTTAVAEYDHYAGLDAKKAQTA